MISSVADKGNTNFPSHDIDPAEKNSDWCMRYLRAIYKDATTRQFAKIFFAARDDYKKFDDYALGNQSVLPYRKWLTGSETPDKTWLNINWEIPTIGPKYRNIVINKLLEREYNITCTPVDPEAVDDTAKWYADMKAKTMMRGVAGKVNPDLLQTNALSKKTGDPEDMEDFQMRTQLGFKTKLAMDAELGIQVVLLQTDFEEERRMVVTDFVDRGVGIYEDCIDENDQPQVKRLDGMNFMCNYCKRNDFGDMTHGAIQVWMTLSEISPYFSPEQLKKIAENVAGKNGNPRSIPFNFSLGDYDKFKVLVLDGKWLSYDSDYWKRGFDSRGNYKFRKKMPDKRDGAATVDVQGSDKPKFIRDTTQVVYRGKWIVDTDYVFDYGLMTDQKRKRSNIKKTRLPFHAYAPDFKDMFALGIMRRMIQPIDDYCLTYFKIQNFKNRWIPYIINIDISALENIPLGKGGEKLKPLEVLDMLFETNIIVTRSKNFATGMSGEQARPVTVESTQMAQEITVLISELQRAIQTIRDVTGLNEVVDGTGPMARTNVTANQQAQQGSNNAINHFAYAESKLIRSVADASLMNLQRVIKRKKVSGYVHSLGSNYVKFVQVSPGISNHEYAIATEDKPNDDAKQTLLQQLAIKDQQGLILPEDYFAITNMTNLKEMEQRFVYSSKKRQQQQQQDQAAQQQNAAQSSIQTAQAAEQAKQSSLILEYQQKKELADVVGAWNLKVADRQAGGQMDQASLKMVADIIMQAMGQPTAGANPPGAGGPAPGAPQDGSGQAQPPPGQQDPSQAVPASLQE